MAVVTTEALGALSMAERVFSSFGVDASAAFEPGVVSLKRELLEGAEAAERGGDAAAGAAAGAARQPVAPPRVVAVGRLACRNCGNRDQSMFKFDSTTADQICTACGTVAMSNLAHEGEDHRNFADSTENRSHAGRETSVLLSSGYNLGTILLGGSTGAESTAGQIKKDLSRAFAAVEMNQNDTDVADRHTREWYKNKQKMKGFELIRNACDRLFLGEKVKDRAMVLFSVFRDRKEKVQKLMRVLACCVVLGYEEFKDVVEEELEEVLNFVCPLCGGKFLNPRKLEEHDCPKVPAEEKEAKARAKKQRDVKARSRRRKLNHLDTVPMTAPEPRKKKRG